MQTFETAVLSRSGGRNDNQDQAQFHTLGASGCWVVADGLGGHFGGEQAALLASQALVGAFKQQTQCSPETLGIGFERAHGAILRSQAEDPQRRTMRTTAVSLIAGPSGVLWGHVGDSRLYWFRGGRRVFRTTDHTLSQILEAHPRMRNPSRGRHQLARSLGQSEALEPSVLPTVQPVDAGDAFLLCSDGFWEALDATEMEIDLAKSASPQDWLDRLEERLMDHGGHRGDNYTALAVFCHHPLGNVGSVPLPRDPEVMAPAAHLPSKRPTKSPLWKVLPLLAAGSLTFVIGVVAAEYLRQGASGGNDSSLTSSTAHVAASAPPNATTPSALEPGGTTSELQTSAALSDLEPAQRLETRQNKDHQMYVWIPHPGRQTGFWIGQTEATVGAYEVFRNEHGYPDLEQPAWSSQDHPMVNIPWDIASTFCVWAGGRLPHYDEWRLAASDGSLQQLYPWGDHPPGCQGAQTDDAVFIDCPHLNAQPVDSSRPTENLHLHHIVGNVAEWGWEKPEPGRRIPREEETAPTFGGSWKSEGVDLQLDRAPIELRKIAAFDTVGFRCVLTREPQP